MLTELHKQNTSGREGAFQLNITHDGPSASLYVTVHTLKFQALFPGLLMVLGKDLAPTAGSLQFFHLQISVFTASQTLHRAALVSVLEAAISCSCSGQAAELSAARFIIQSIS